MPKINKICSVCHKEYSIYPYRDGKSNFCSRKCYWKSLESLTGKLHHNWTRKEILCLKCGKLFEIPRCRINDGQRYCSKSCAAEFRITSEKVSGKYNCNWNGGVSHESNGYIDIKSPNHPRVDCRGYVREHRLVMEKYLGRYLKKEEHVHHINGIKSDNRIENLMLFNNESEHQKYHHALKKSISNTLNT